VFRAVGDMAVDDWQKILDTNLTGVFYCCRAALPHLRARGGGWIINIGSLSGKHPFAEGAAYCASKEAILPAALVMVVVAPRSAKLVEARGARFTLLCGYVFLFAAFLWMLLLWKEGASYWQIAVAYIFIGAGVGLAGTPASHSLTGSVPVTRAGMASGTADLQRDLGGAVMQSIFGALLTAGYAASVSSQIAASDKSITDSTQAALTKSFASAEAVAGQHPEYSSAIISGAKVAFLQGDDWAYAAGVIAIVLGAVLVFFMFPKHDEEQRLLALYHETDSKELGAT